MKAQFIPTNTYYHRLLEIPDDDARCNLYVELFVDPWRQMMSMMPRAGNAAADDPLAGARAWAWLLPDQVEQIEAMLAKLEAADAWGIGEAALRQAAARFDPYAGLIPFDTITGWLVLADPSRSNPMEAGYTGATDWFQPRFIGQFWRPDERTLPRLPGLVAHEMHHLIRMRAFPWGPQTSVADYIVIEGTAESFATSLFGEDTIGLFIEDFDPADLDNARRLIGAGLDVTGFDMIRGYVFGDQLAEKYNFRAVGGMPTYGGYAVGYHVVQAFLKRTGQTIEEATFLPARQIVEESGFFA